LDNILFSWDPASVKSVFFPTEDEAFYIVLLTPIPYVLAAVVRFILYIAFVSFSSIWLRNLFES